MDNQFDFGDDILNINTQVFAVHKKYPDENLPGGRIKVCRVKTYKNVKGKVTMVLTEVGKPNVELSSDVLYLYRELKDAINAITTKENARKN